MSACINAAQGELYFVYTCIQQSFQNDSKEGSMEETNTSFLDIYIVDLDSSSCVYTKTDDLSDE